MVDLLGDVLGDVGDVVGAVLAIGRSVERSRSMVSHLYSDSRPIDAM
jgi:hypothetical protein